MNTENIIVEVHDKVGVITINRPKQLNALDIATLEQMENVLQQLEDNDQVHVIVVTGAGDKAFVAGGDIADLNSRQGLDHYNQFAEVIHRVFKRFEETDKPTIGAINGWALGGGVELLLTLDIRLVANEAKLGLPEINLGLFPGAGGTQRAIRQIPLCKAKEMMFLGEQMSAEEAVRIGLCNHAYPREILLDEAMKMAHRIAEKSPLVLKILKRNLRYGKEMPLASALAHDQALIGLVLDSKDAHEGCSAFLEKRKAVFTGA